MCEVPFVLSQRSTWAKVQRWLLSAARHGASKGLTFVSGSAASVQKIVVSHTVSPPGQVVPSEVFYSSTVSFLSIGSGTYSGSSARVT